MNEQELKESAAVFTRLLGDPIAGAAAARGRDFESVPEAAPIQPREASKNRIATREFVERTIAAAVGPLKLRESEAVRAESAEVFGRILGNTKAGEAAARRR